MHDTVQKQMLEMFLLYVSILGQKFASFSKWNLFCKQAGAEELQISSGSVRLEFSPQHDKKINVLTVQTIHLSGAECYRILSYKPKTWSFECFSHYYCSHPPIWNLRPHCPPLGHIFSHILGFCQFLGVKSTKATTVFNHYVVSQLKKHTHTQKLLSL